MTRKGATGRLSMKIDGVFHQTGDAYAPPSEDVSRQVSRLLNLDNSQELEKYMREQNVVLALHWRCRCKNNKGWRCNNITREQGTQCVQCGEGRTRRYKHKWAESMVKDSWKKDRELKRKIGAESSMVTNSRYEDRYKGRDFENPQYIDVPYLRALRQKQNTKCYWCNVVMLPENRKQVRGMTVDRLDDGAHLKHHCVLSCFSCNCKSYRYGWCPYPKKLAKILKIPDVNEKNYFNPKRRSKKFPSRLAVNRWQRLQEELIQLPQFA